MFALSRKQKGAILQQLKLQEVQVLSRYKKALNSGEKLHKNGNRFSHKLRAFAMAKSIIGNDCLALSCESLSTRKDFESADVIDLLMQAAVATALVETNYEFQVRSLEAMQMQRSAYHLIALHHNTIAFNNNKAQNV